MKLGHKKMVVLAVAALVGTWSNAATSRKVPTNAIDTACRDFGEVEIDAQQNKVMVATADYPQRAMSRGEEGIVTFKVLVGIDTRAQACWIVKSSGSQTLDDHVCKGMMTKARFSISHDTIGQPRSYCWGGRAEYRLAG